MFEPYQTQRFSKCQQIITHFIVFVQVTEGSGNKCDGILSHGKLVFSHFFPFFIAFIIIIAPIFFMLLLSHSLTVYVSSAHYNSDNPSEKLVVALSLLYVSYISAAFSLY